MKKTWWTTLTVALGLGMVIVLLAVSGGGLAQPVGSGSGMAAGDADLNVGAGEASPLRSTSSVSTTTVPSLVAAGGGIASVSDSSVTTENCYDAGTSQMLCFTVHNGSTDAEWLDQVRLTFPVMLGNWTVSCKSQDAADSSGNPVNFTCSTPSPNEVLYTDSDLETPVNIGEVSAGSSWGFCVDVSVPGGYNGNRLINWGLSGDEEPGSSTPHDITGTTTIEQCTPLMLKPASLAVEGCNGITQTHTFELWNHSAGSGDFALSYEVSPEGSEFTGPTSFTLSAGEIVTFLVQLEPDFFLKPGEQVTATLGASGNGESDSSTLVNTITALAGWQGRTFSPVPTMDNVVVWASYEDGGLWSIGGYGSNGATQRYDPDAPDDNFWTTHTPEMVVTPTIEYPMDGCYGLNGEGHEVVVLFPDTIVTGTLHIFDITADNWYTQTVPGFYPPEGRWGQDIVSLLNIPGVEQNVCYLSGGSTQEGGGRTRDLWVYYPDGTPGKYIGNFLADIWFGFHASWYVPWVGDEGAICVGGGIDHNSQTSSASATQCYDLATETFNTANADLGPLPEPWWGMADGWQTYDGRHQIWIANGVAQDGTLLPASAYADETTGGFVYGPELPVSLYRLEGDGFNGQFHTEQGAAGGFNYSYYNQLLVQCPECKEIYLPMVLRNAQ